MHDIAPAGPEQPRVVFVSSGRTRRRVWTWAALYAAATASCAFINQLRWLVMAAVGVFAFAILFYRLTISVAVAASGIQKRSPFSSAEIPMAAVISAVRMSRQGIKFLVVRSRTSRLVFSEHTFSDAQLSEIQSAVQSFCAAQGNQILLSNPPPTVKAVYSAVVIYLGGLILAVTIIVVLGLRHLHQIR